MSDFLHDSLREMFRDSLPDDQEYSDSFDRLEIFLSLLALDVRSQRQSEFIYINGPVFGRFTWRSPRASYTRRQNGRGTRRSTRSMASAKSWLVRGRRGSGNRSLRAVFAGLRSGQAESPVLTVTNLENH
jgi:hypothetical protein